MVAESTRARAGSAPDVPRARLWRRRRCAVAARVGAGLGLLLALAGCGGTGTPPAVPVVTIAARAASVTAGEPLQFSVRAEPAPAADLTVRVTIAYGGCGVAQLSTSVTIGAGDSSTTLTVPTGGAAGCTVRATIAAGQGYRAGRSAEASAVTAVTGSTAPPVEPVVTIAADAPEVAEGEEVSFTLTAVPAPKSALPVTVNWSVDRVVLTEPGPRTVTIPTGGTFNLRAATRDDGDHEPDGVVTVTVSDGSGYAVGTPGSARVDVADNDAGTSTGTPPASPAPRATWRCPPGTGGGSSCPFVTVLAADSSVTEGAVISLTLTAQPAPASDTTVSLEPRYERARVEAVPTTVTFAAGTSTVAITVNTIDNMVTDGGSFLRVVLNRRAASDSNAYGLGSDSPIAHVTIADND